MHSNAERSVVSFDGVAHWWTGYPNSYYDFQFVLYPSGDLELNYRSITGTHSATIGIQNGSGSAGLQVNFNGEYVHDELSVKFSKGPVNFLLFGWANSHVCSIPLFFFGSSLFFNPLN